MTLDEAVYLEAGDPEWQERFDRERQRLLSALPVARDAIEHIGSTAVPGLLAKPVLDVMIGVAQLPPSPELSEALCACGYEDLGEAGVAGRFYFRMRAPRAINVHVVRRDGVHWANNLLLRDYLRAEPSAREEYARAKRAALAQERMLLAYSSKKAPIVEELLRRAACWRARA